MQNYFSLILSTSPSNLALASSLPTLGTSFLLGFSQGKGSSFWGVGECLTWGLMQMEASILMRSHSDCSFSSVCLRHAE